MNLRNTQISKGKSKSKNHKENKEAEPKKQRRIIWDGSQTLSIGTLPLPFLNLTTLLAIVHHP